MTLSPHYSVMLKEVMAALSPKDGALYVDGTFGAGGYSRALLTAADCMVIGIDRDPHALKIGAEMGQEFKGRLRVLSGCFGDMKNLLNAQGITKIDGLALDIGVSSMQIDDCRRGFSFQGDGPLEPRPNRFSDLTPRETEILCHLAAGQSNKVIARELGISDGTVKLHVKSILRKLHVHSRVEAAVIAVEAGVCRSREL